MKLNGEDIENIATTQPKEKEVKNEKLVQNNEMRAFNKVKQRPCLDLINLTGHVIFILFFLGLLSVGESAGAGSDGHVNRLNYGVKFELQSVK